MTAIKGIMHSYPIGPHRLAIIGHEPLLSRATDWAHDRAVRLGADTTRVAKLVVASDANKAGHKLIVVDTFNGVSQADGVLLSKPYSAGVIQTADCPALALYDEVSGNLVLAHAGRPALTPGEHCASCTVVANALSALIGSTGDHSRVQARVIGNICGTCFKHDLPGARKYIEPFLKLPSQVFADKALGALDLFEVIKHELMHVGVPTENISHVGPCTLESEHLASHRRGDETRNTVILLRGPQ
jgi:copper oxidase (laccase) domain-containing protein